VDLFAQSDALLKDNAEHQLWYGTALMQNGNLDAAREHLDAALALTKSDAKTQPLAQRVSAEAQKAIKSLKSLAKAQEKAGTKPAPEATQGEQPEGGKKTAEPGKPTATSTAPIIEEPQGGEPTPIIVPGPR
jgi:predicted Zn-dependent protease